jgi:hypothetical protein
LSSSPFTAASLLSACKSYHEENRYPGPYQEEPVYRLFVLDDPARRAELRPVDAVEYLELWDAYNFRYAARGLSRARRFLRVFLYVNGRDLRRLAGNRLEDMSESDFDLVRNLMEQVVEGLRFGTDRRRAPTAAGKLLHYLLPDGVIMWDREKVQDRAYQIGDTVEDFMRYQKFGRNLLRYLADVAGCNLTKLSAAHSNQCGLSYREPLPKMLDEMAYHRPTARAALAVVGWPT